MSISRLSPIPDTLRKIFSKLRISRRPSAETACESHQQIESVKPVIDELLDLLTKCTDFNTPEVGDALQSLMSIPSMLCDENCDDTDDLSDSISTPDPVFAVHCQNVGRYLVEAGYVQLFVKIAKSLKHHVCGGSRNELQQGWDNFGWLCWGIINFSEFSPEIGKELANHGGVAILFEALDFLQKNVTRRKSEISTVKMQLLVLCIVYHCRHNNRQEYRQANAVTILTKYLQSKDPSRKMYALLVLASVVSDKENKLLKAKDCVRFLMDLLKKGVQSPNHTAVFTDVEKIKVAITVKDMLDGLVHLAINDDNKIAIDNLGGTSLMDHISESQFTDEEKQFASEVIWALSFDDSIRKSVNFRKATESVKKHTKSQHKALQMASTYATWESEGNQLQAQEAEVQQAEPSQATTVNHPQPGHVMLSYQWDSQIMVGKIKKKLDKAGYNVWMDSDKMRGDMLQAMAEAVEKAEVVIICMSEKYKDSFNCRSEATYAYKLQKRVIPLLVEDGYNPDGWLGLLAGMQLYYRFCTGHEYKSNIPNLIDAIGNSGRAVPPGH